MGTQPPDGFGRTGRGGHAGAGADLSAVAAPGISYDGVVTRSEDQGVAESAAAWQDLVDAVKKSPGSKGADTQ
ncbi:hypothetical protein SZN_14863 [Streptomyces zinciresistens K42]|uniref:Uncharacterized protein n=1 Tax=Streptomyces zinciresistens K42 TaxID=700597 RepID=G2GBT5_9ACTN|nr:hypothetical protein SZN_14863 [Streptomyces zinciresistens K42]